MAAAEDAKSDVRTSALARLGGAAGAEFLIERFRSDSSYRAQAGCGHGTRRDRWRRGFGRP